MRIFVHAFLFCVIANPTFAQEGFQRKLEAVDFELLRYSLDTYVINGISLTSSAGGNADSLTRLAETLDGQRAILARLFIIQDLIYDETSKQLRIQKEVRERLFRDSFAALIDGIAREETERAAEFEALGEGRGLGSREREAIWSGFEETLKALQVPGVTPEVRLNQLGQARKRVQCVAAEVMDRLYFTPLDGDAVPSLDVDLFKLEFKGAGSVQVSQQRRSTTKLPIMGMYQGFEFSDETRMKIIEVCYTGKEPLTNVIAVGQILTKPMPQIKQRVEPRVSGLIDFMGGSSVNYEAMVRSRDQLTWESSSHIFSIKQLKPGDKFGLLMGEINTKAIRDVSFVLRSDQGLLKKQHLDWPQKPAAATSGNSKQKPLDGKTSGLLEAARKLEKNNPDGARKLYLFIIQKYADDSSAKIAKERLEELEYLPKE